MKNRKGPIKRQELGCRFEGKGEAWMGFIIKARTQENRSIEYFYLRRQGTGRGESRSAQEGLQPIVE